MSPTTILPIATAEPASEDGDATLANCAGSRPGEFQNLVANALQFARQDGRDVEERQIPPDLSPTQSRQSEHLEPLATKLHSLGPQSKDAKSGGKISETNSGKKRDGHSAVSANHVANAEKGVAAENPQNMPVSVLAPALSAGLPEKIVPVLNPKNDSNEKSAQRVSTAQNNGVIEISKARQNLGASSFFESGNNHVAREDSKSLPLTSDDAAQIARKTIPVAPEIPDKSLTSAAGQLAKNTAAAPVENGQAPMALEKSSDGAESHQSKVENPAPQNVAALDSKPPATATPLIHGTTVAQQDAQMSKPENANKVAGQDGQSEKVLPGKSGSPPVEKSLSVRFSVPTRADKAGHVQAGNLSATISARVSDAIATAHSASGNSPTMDKLSSVNSASTLPVSNSSTRAVDRMQDLVALNATRLRDANLDSLRVVIKPDAGMELSLELRQRGDSVDVRAVLQQGDFNQLNQQWPELQLRLEQRGVKLEPLAGQNFSSDESYSFQQRKNQSQDLLDQGSSSEFSFANSTNRSQPRQKAGAVVQSGWQTWA